MILRVPTKSPRSSGKRVLSRSRSESQFQTTLLAPYTCTLHCVGLDCSSCEHFAVLSNSMNVGMGDVGPGLSD